MRISIITVCYNSAATIEDTIRSVLGQDYPDIEYIIIDGGSTDGTLGIVSKYKDRIAKIISEPDKGIYDAMNKGIRLSSGDVVGIINSDDFYTDGRVLSAVMQAFRDGGADACYGDLVYVGRKDTGKIVRVWRAGNYENKKLASGWVPPHPAFFARKIIYDKLGAFNTDFKIAADYELMLRFLKNNIKIAYINKPLASMREGGNSAKSFGQRQAGWKELKLSWTKNGWKVPPFFILRRVLSKIHQYFV